MVGRLMDALIETVHDLAPFEVEEAVIRVPFSEFWPSMTDDDWQKLVFLAMATGRIKRGKRPHHLVAVPSL